MSIVKTNIYSTCPAHRVGEHPSFCWLNPRFHGQNFMFLPWLNRVSDRNQHFFNHQGVHQGVQQLIPRNPEQIGRMTTSSVAFSSLRRPSSPVHCLARHGSSSAAGTRCPCCCWCRPGVGAREGPENQRSCVMYRSRRKCQNQKMKSKFFWVRNWFVSNSNQLQLCVLFLSNDLAWTPFYSLCYAKAAATVAWCSLSSDHLQKWDGEVSKKYSPDFYWLLLFLGLCSVLAEWNCSRGPCATMWEDVRNYWAKATWAYTHLQGVLRKTCATTITTFTSIICNGFPLDRCMQSVGICIDDCLLL